MLIEKLKELLRIKEADAKRLSKIVISKPNCMEVPVEINVIQETEKNDG